MCFLKVGETKGWERAISILAKRREWTVVYRSWEAKETVIRLVARLVNHSANHVARRR